MSLQSPHNQYIADQGGIWKIMSIAIIFIKGIFLILGIALAPTYVRLEYREKSNIFKTGTNYMGEKLKWLFA